jgi:hypothetical protein
MTHPTFKKGFSRKQNLNGNQKGVNISVFNLLYKPNARY